MSMLKNTISVAVLFAFRAAIAAEADPEKAFDQAFAAGEPLVAENAFRSIVEANPSTAPIRYFQAAEVARQLGRETLRRDRLASYLRSEKGWNASTEEAAWYLCRNGGSVDQFARLAASVSASDELYNVGMELLHRAGEGKRGQEVAKLAEVLLAKFPSDARRYAVLNEVLSCKYRNAPGLTAKAVCEMILRYPTQELGTGDGWTLQWYLMTQGAEYPADFRLEWCKKLGKALPPMLFCDAGSGVNQFKPDSTNAADVVYCQRLAKLFKEVEPLVLKDGNGPQANTLLYNEIRLARHYFKPGETNEQAVCYFNLFEKTLKCYPQGKADVQQMKGRTSELWHRGLLRNGRTDYWTKLRETYPQYLDDAVLIYWSPMRAVAEKAKNVDNLKAFCTKNPDRAWAARDWSRDLYAAFGETKQVLDDIETIFLRNACRDVNGGSILGWLEKCKLADAEKVAFLKKIYGRLGAHSFFVWLKNDKGAQNTLTALKSPEGQAFLNEIDVKKPASDGFTRRLKEMLTLQRGKDYLAPERAHQLMAETFAEYKAPYPQEGRPENAAIDQTLGHYFELCRHNQRSCEAFAEVLLKAFGSNQKAPWGYLGEVQGNLREKPELAVRVCTIRSEILGNPDCWSDILCPSGTDKLPACANFDKMGYGTLYYLLRRNISWQLSGDDRRRVTFSEPLQVQGISAFFRNFSVPKANVDQAIEVLNWLGPIATNRALMAQFPFDKLAGETLDFDKGFVPALAPRFLELAAATGRSEGYLKRYLASLDRLEPSMRVHPLVGLLGCYAAVPWTEAKDKGTDWYGQILAKNLLPTLKAVSDAKASLVAVTGERLPSWYFIDRYNRYFDHSLRRGDPAAQKLREDINCEIARLDAGGCRGVSECRLGFYLSAYNRALQTTNAVGMVKVADTLGRYAGGVWWETMADLLNRTRKAEAWQPLYLLVSAIPNNVNADLYALASRYRAEAATKLPGIYPVGPKDPAYPLYVAADEYSRKNAEGALKLFSKNVEAFERELLKLPPDFVAWGVDQLRIQRGEKDALLVLAMELATKVIAAESKATPELVAAMLLVRAECHRDRQNFEAAKLEYQSIRDNPAYHKTPSGRRAMFRAVDLQIESGQGTQAEQTLEYWLSQPDPEIQAEAHYFLARIAFDRKDFDECIKQLKEVFAINLTHTEARFLQGKWKLATNNEVDETEVWIGNLADRTTISPGQQLSITVQDRNLSVAGGGNSIPVIVTTDKGKDCERVYLYPSVRDPNLFKGFIDVRLAAAAPSNTVLDVRGDDTASYTIDPEYLKARGLPLNVPKRLRVVADAKLAIGAGAPRADGDSANTQIASMVGDAADPNAKSIATVLRPGNPLYIAVSDKDRSLGGKADQVKVSVHTTSGDRLGRVMLTETKPFSGVFRGMIPTSLPPPRAFASDTATGFNPGDVINSTREGLWRSLADSQPNKWFAVDTMGSHVVSNVTLRMPSAEEVTSLRLVGVLGDDELVLSTFPATDPKKRVGLLFQTAVGNGVYGEDLIRQLLAKSKEAPVAVSNVCYRPAEDGKANVARYAGAFLQPSGYDYLRFRIRPVSGSVDALRDCALSVSIDGKSAFRNHGTALQGAVIVADVTPGAHFLEVFVTAKSARDDAFDLVWEPFGEEVRAIPADWFDADRHKEVWDYVADKAVIARTKDGFSATFTNPQRLRKLRWEFVTRTGPDVAISEMTATDTDGRMFLPVPSDFSDAQSNDTLEVAPGDQITVRYEDAVTASGTKRILERSLGSCFTDLGLRICFEHVAGGGTSSIGYFDAYRFVPGDTMVVVVDDTDLDISEKADSIEATVETADGVREKLTLLEQPPTSSNWEPENGVHTGRFLGLLKTIPESDALPTNANRKVSTKVILRTKSDDSITVSVEDRENTRPGVPCLRTASVYATHRTQPRLTLFHAKNERVVDTSEAGRLRLAEVRKRSGNEKIDKVFRDNVFARPMTPEESDSTNAIPENAAAPVLVRVNHPSHARHSASCLTLEAVTLRELDRSEAEGDKPAMARATMKLGGGFDGVTLRAGEESFTEARRAGSFNGLIHLAVGAIDNVPENVLRLLRNGGNVRDWVPPVLAVNGTDIIRLRVKDGETVLLERTLSLAANASFALLDSTWTAERDAVHVGETFFLQVKDTDCDTSDEADNVIVTAKSKVTGRTRPVVLIETIPHSGVFNGVLRPVLFPEEEPIPPCVTGAVADVKTLVAEDRFAARYGDRIEFTYRDERVLPGCEPRTLCATGIVHRGSKGRFRLFSKRFRDSDQAVLVQFRLAECLFEQAKEFRTLKQPDKSAEAIAKGRFILEEALKNFPDSAHVTQGEFLLANLFQELAAEQRTAKNEQEAVRLYTDALARFSSIVSASPEGEYAARSQYHKALCLEMLADYRRAAEEYVKMTYLYPDSDLVGDATIRLATHYYTREKRYDVAARIYDNFQRRFPQHNKASRSLFMCGSCYVKQAEKLRKDAEAAAAKAGRPLGGEVAGVRTMYVKAADAFARIVETCRDTATPELRAQALYWAGDAQLRSGQPKKAYLSLKRCVLEYPETEWARRARGLLLQESDTFDHMEEG